MSASQDTTFLKSLSNGLFSKQITCSFKFAEPKRKLIMNDEVIKFSELAKFLPKQNTDIESNNKL